MSTQMTEQLKALAEAVVNNDKYSDSLLKEFSFQSYATPERILALIAENERLTHSRKDAEPVGWKCFHCVKESCYSPTPARQEDQRDTHPPDADKLLQQALEALEYRLQQTRPIHQADSVMEAIRTYLEGKK